jgi:ribosomal protein L11 methyltransferase
MLRWTRLTTAKWEDSWAERLTFLGPDRVAFITWPNGKTVRIEAFVDEETAAHLVREFGGKVTKAPLWTGDPAPPRAPLQIRNRLTIFPDLDSFQKWRAGPRKKPGIFVPAGMAFGTGDHATTASCLRMLADLSRELPADWTALDAGTGSGILALAARALGAARVEAFDNDPACVRITKENAKLNSISGVKTTRADVTNWQPAARHDVVLANLFSELLIRVIPTLKAAVKPSGHLIFSGVLRDQLDAVTTAFEFHGFRIHRTVVRGKWSAGHCQL